LLIELLRQNQLVVDHPIEEIRAFCKCFVTKLKTDFLSVGSLWSLIEVELFKVPDLLRKGFQTIVGIIPQLLSDNLIVLLQKHHADLFACFLVFNPNLIVLLAHFLLKL
jgi:hypothetical protein